MIFRYIIWKFAAILLGNLLVGRGVIRAGKTVAYHLTLKETLKFKSVLKMKKDLRKPLVEATNLK